MHNTNASSRHACGCFLRRKERGNTFGKSGRIFRMDCLSLSCDNYFLWNTEEYNTHCDTQSLLCLSKIAWSMKLQPHTVWPPQHLHLSSIRREWQHIYAESDNIYQRLEYCSVTKKISLSFSTLFLSRCLSLSLCSLTPEVCSVCLRSYFILDLHLKFLNWNCQDFPGVPQCKLL